MNTYSYSDSELIDAIKKSKSIAETMRNLGLKPKGEHYTKFHNRIKIKNIDITHFQSNVNGKAHNKLSKNDFIKKHCIINSNVTSYKLKTKLIEFGIMKNECISCKNTGEWNNKNLVLQIDHIDGNRKNCLIGNLRILCPNCHSQTETFGNKNSVRY
jgi:5-methylcytosine-specific restriction endonuclease McrA